MTPTSAHGTKGGTDRVRPDKVAKAAAATPAPAGAAGPRPPKAGAWGDDLSYQQWDMHSIFVPRTHAHNIKGKGVKVRACGQCKLLVGPLQHLFYTAYLAAWHDTAGFMCLPVQMMRCCNRRPCTPSCACNGSGSVGHVRLPGLSAPQVGILDTGLDYTHPDIGPQVDYASSVSCVSGVANGTREAWSDPDGHGTW